MYLFQKFANLLPLDNDKRYELLKVFKNDNGNSQVVFFTDPEAQYLHFGYFLKFIKLNDFNIT